MRSLLTNPRYLSACLLALCLLVTSGAVPAQETRGTFTGIVKDTSGGVVPGAAVEASHLATGTKVSTVTNETGNYLLPYLSSGAYQISVKREGFKRYARERVELRLGEVLTLDVTLEVGGVAESIVVTDKAPLFDKTSASLATVIDTRALEELPIREGTVAELATLAPGVMYGTHIRLAKPGMTGGISSLSTDGSTLARNEFTIDGVPNVAGDNAIAYSPPAAAIAEFRVGTTTYDASVGHAIGGMMDMVTKSGTNQYHGLIQLVERNAAFDAWSSFAKAAKTPKYVYQDHHGVAAVGGPVNIPKLYRGKDRTFFFVTVDYNKYGNPFPNQATVPTAAERTGDMSGLFALGSAADYQIYDPATTRLIDGKYVRDPIPNNIIPAARINPIAKKLVDYWPLPNLSSVTSNFQVRDAMEHQRYKTVTSRVDHNFSAQHRTYVRFTWDKWNVKQMNRFENAASGADMYSRNTQAGLDHVYTITPSLVLNLKYGYARKRRWEDQLHAGEWTRADWKTAGFSDRLLSLIPDRSVYFPRIAFADGLTEFGWAGWSGAVPYDGAADTHTAAAHFSLVKANHNLTFGGDFRVYRETYATWLIEQPYTYFGTTYTRRDNTAAAPRQRAAFTAFMMGYHDYTNMGITDNWAAQNLWSGWYLQDNWKLSPRLTLNLGLRYELEDPVTERYDRMLNGFDTTTPLPIEPTVRAKYAANPFPEVPAGQLNVRGGYLFASADNRGLWKRDNSNWMPRIGLAFMVSQKTTLNAGYGIYYENLGLTNTVNPRQPGFSRTTSVSSSNDNGLNFVTSFADPIRDGLLQPVGKSLGLMTDIDGGGRTFERFITRNPYSQRWSFSLQRELPLNAFLRTTYIGGHSLRLMINRNLNAVPLQYLSTSPVRDQAKIDWMNANVPNPFRGVAGVTGGLSTNTTMTRAQLLRPSPQFGDYSMGEPSGYSTYHALQVEFDRRFAQGFDFGGAYTYSKTMEASSFLNGADPAPFYQISSNDRTHMFNVHSIVHLPFGRGRKYGSTWHGAVNHLLGGWQIGTLLRLQGGAPMSFGQYVLKPGKKLTDILLPGEDRDIRHYFKNYNYYLDQNGGNAAAATAQMNAEYPFEVATSISSLSWNVRTIPDRFSWIRAPGYVLLDTNLKKEIQFGESKSLTIRVDASNVLNKCNWLNVNTGWANPTTFGVVGSQNGYPRQLQLWLTFKF
jgi:hypothetical protein